MIKLTSNFQPNSTYTTDFIVEQIIPKLNDRLPCVEEATKEELILAVSGFFAHGMNNYVVDCSGNPLLTEVLKKLVGYGWLQPHNTVKDVYRLSIPNSRLEFATVNRDTSVPTLDTSYKTRYLDGSFSEVNRDHITLIDGYPAITWKVINLELQVAYVTGKQEQPSRQYITLDGEKLSTTLLKADREELQATHNKIIEAAASTDGVWKYQDGLIGHNLPMIEKAVRDAVIKVVGKANFKFLAVIEQNNYSGEIDTVESIGGTN